MGLCAIAPVVLVFFELQAFAEEESTESADSVDTDAVVAALSLWDQAREAVGLGEIERAARLLARSYEAHADGLTACELGRVHRRLGRRADAVRWLRTCASDQELPEETRAHAEDEARLLDSQVGILTIPELPEGTRLVVDGRVRDIDGDQRQIELIPGSHRVDLVDSNDGVTRIEVTVPPGETTSLPEPEPDPDAVTPETRRRYRAFRTTLWVSLGTSLALALGTGVAVGFDVSLSTQRDPAADDARLASAILGGLTGLGLTVALSLIPYLVSLRRAIREANRPNPPSRTP